MTGHASALVALDFFAGFVIGKPVFGALVDVSRSYLAGWLLRGPLFAGAVALPPGWRRSRLRHVL
ncbi:MAG: hypothetical protein DLM67_08925 [Candidatus Nephthysia bennettiae]|nr:MAG: hypothetical protein DLM67_08925 [Candidatus Dormibacteraeota bacterium]